MNYNDRISFYNLEPLELRRLHNDLKMLLKILHSHVIINMNNSISVSQTNYTRGNLYRSKLVKFRAKCDVRKFFFMHRPIELLMYGIL